MATSGSAEASPGAAARRGTADAGEQSATGRLCLPPAHHMKAPLRLFTAGQRRRGASEMSVAEHVDELHPLAETWRRPVTIQDTPSWWREVARLEERSGNPNLANQYRQMADTLDRALAARRGGAQ